jgi:hypothetical protein
MARSIIGWYSLSSLTNAFSYSARASAHFFSATRAFPFSSASLVSFFFGLAASSISWVIGLSFTRTGGVGPNSLTGTEPSEGTKPSASMETVQVPPTRPR